MRQELYPILEEFNDDVEKLCDGIVYLREQLEEKEELINEKIKAESIENEINS